MKKTRNISLTISLVLFLTITVNLFSQPDHKKPAKECSGFQLSLAIDACLQSYEDTYDYMQKRYIHSVVGMELISLMRSNRFYAYHRAALVSSAAWAREQETVPGSEHEYLNRGLDLFYKKHKEIEKLLDHLHAARKTGANSTIILALEEKLEPYYFMHLFSPLGSATRIKIDDKEEKPVITIMDAEFKKVLTTVKSKQKFYAKIKLSKTFNKDKPDFIVVSYSKNDSSKKRMLVLHETSNDSGVFHTGPDDAVLVVSSDDVNFELDCQNRIEAESGDMINVICGQEKASVEFIGTPTVPGIYIMDKTFETRLANIDLGERFWVYLVPGVKVPSREQALFPDPYAVNEIKKVKLFTENKDFGTLKPIKLALTETKQDSGRFRCSEEGILATYDDESPVKQKIVTIVGDIIHAEYENHKTAVQVNMCEFEDDPEETELPYKLESISELVTKIDQITRTDSIKVQLLAVDEEPMQHVKIKWDIFMPKGPVPVVSTTNEDGIAECMFFLKRDGNFAVLGDGMEVKNFSLFQGSYYIEASVEEGSITGWVKDEPQGFYVTLTRPVMISFLHRERGGYISYLLNDQRFQLEIIDAESKTATDEEIKAVVSSSKDRITPTLYRYPKDSPKSPHYLTERSIVAFERDRPTVAPEIEVPPGESITARYKKASASIPVYKNWIYYELAKVNEALELYHKIFKEAVDSSKLKGEHLDAAIARYNAVCNALELVDVNKENLKYYVNYHKLFTGIAYLQMLASGEVAFTRDEGITPDPEKLYGCDVYWHSLEFTSQHEAEKVYKAFELGDKYQIQWLSRLPKEIKANIYNAVADIPHMIASPAYGAYVLFSGQTLDGERATVVEQVLGGVEMATFIFATVKFVPHVSRFCNIVEAQSFRTMINEAEKALAKTGKKINRIADIDEKVKTRERYIKKNKGEIAKRRENIEKIKKKIKEAEEKLKTETRPKKRAELLDEIASRNNTLAGVKNAMARFNKANKYHRKILKKARKKLNRLRKKNLSPEQIKQLAYDKKIPDSRDRINGRTAWWQYEQQINRELAKQGFVPGNKLPCSTVVPYRVIPMKDGKFNPAKKPVLIRRPHPDHMDTATFDIADSKYYDFKTKYKTEPYQVSAAKTIADTVQKATVYQKHWVRMAMPDASEDVIKKKIRGSRIYIYTPNEMPNGVKKMIRKLVGKLDSSRLEFLVRKPDFEDWINY